MKVGLSAESPRVLRSSAARKSSSNTPKRQTEGFWGDTTTPKVANCRYSSTVSPQRSAPPSVVTNCQIETCWATDIPDSCQSPSIERHSFLTNSRRYRRCGRGERREKRNLLLPGGRDVLAEFGSSAIRC